eukprot:16435048-Heterocapsa_arctica.AAC.1
MNPAHPGRMRSSLVKKVLRGSVPQVVPIYVVSDLQHCACQHPCHEKGRSAPDPCVSKWGGVEHSSHL